MKRVYYKKSDGRIIFNTIRLGDITFGDHGKLGPALQKVLYKLSLGFFYNDDRTYVVGSNSDGRLGDGTTDNKCIPVPIYNNKIFNVISSSYHTLGLDNTGQVWSWGLNDAGQLGINSQVCKCTPVSILGNKKTFCKIDTGQYHSLGLDKFGQVWSWGSNSRGQLGDNSTTYRCTPVSIFGVKKTFCKISADYNNSLGIDKYGQMWSWGYNNFGQLGDNSITSRRTPVSIQGAKKTFCNISTGSDHSLGIDIYGQVWSWGYNAYGQLGDNSKTSRLTPVSIQGVKKTFCDIATGLSHSLGLDYNGQVWSWGYNGQGQLGDNSKTSRRTPVSIQGDKKTFCYISAGFYHSLAIDNHYNIWCWGENTYGGLGDGTTIDRCTPVRVCI